jgi:hypothetical protein
MEIHGTIEANLKAALASAQRLRGHPIYSDTLSHWQKLILEARRALRDEPVTDAETLESQIVQLEHELAERR